MSSPLVAVAMSQASVWAWLVRTSWQAVVLIAIVAAMQLLFGKLLSPRWRYALWMLAVVRLLMPMLPASRWSVFNAELPVAAKTSDVAAPARLQAPEGLTVTILKTFDRDVAPAPVASRATIVLATPRSFDWRRALLAVWLAGAVLLALRVVVAHVLLARRLRRYASPIDPRVIEMLDDCRRAMGVRSNVRVIATDAVSGPALFGFVRPRLLIPPAMLSDLEPHELRFVFLHELAHLKRRDTLTNLPLTLAGALHWFNPLAWFALSRCRTERELACDAMVLEVTDGPARQGYGHTMLRLAEALCTTRRRITVPAALGILETRSQLNRRITMISAFRARTSPRWSVLPVVLLVGVASCALTDKASSDSPASATTQAARGDAKTIDALTTQARQQIKVGKYDDALTTIDRIVELDPTNEYAAGVRPLVKDRLLLAEQRRYRDDFDRQLTRRLNAPSDRAEDAPVDAETAKVRQMLDKRIAELKLDAIPFQDVIDQFRGQAKDLNIFVNWRALEAAGIDRATPVTAHLRDIRLRKALSTVLDEVGGGTAPMGYTIDDGVVTITTQEDLAKNTQTRVYDIRDLIAEVPDYAPEPRPQSAPTTQPQPSQLEQIKQLIQESVEPDSWRDAGGTVGAMRDLAGQLIITATPQMHDEIATLLGQIREARGVQIAVEARFIAIDPAALDKVMGDRLKSTIGKSGAATVWQLGDDEVQAVLKATQQSQQSTLLTAPRITLFNGQRAFVNVSTQTPYVSGFTVTKKDAGETRYEPKVATVDSGIMLDVRATASADRRFATLTLKPKLSRLMSLAPAPYPGAKDLVVQVPLQSVQELQTTLSIPDRATALIGGFTETVESETQAAGSSGALNVTGTTTIDTKVTVAEGGTLLLNGRAATSQPANLNLTLRAPATQNLYLLVKPTLIITQPEKPKEWPLLSTPPKR